MASNSETGHVKNVAAFDDQTGKCSLMGPQYNPSNPAITIQALVSKHGTAKGLLQDVIEAMGSWDKAIRERELAFAPLKPLALEVISALMASGAPDQTVDKAKSWLNKIQGRRAKAIEAPEPPKEGETPEVEKHISVSQQSFDKMMEHFSKLLITLNNEPMYNPNEPELSMNGLNDFLKNLETTNKAVVNLTAQLQKARAARNTCLYAKKTGLVDLAKTTKRYVYSTFKKHSPEYASIKDLKFVDMTKKK